MYATKRVRSLASVDHLAESPFQIGERSIRSRTPRINNDVPLRSNVRPMFSENLSKPALDPVSDHRFANGARNREPQTRTISLRFLPRQAKSGEERTGEASAMVINGSEIGGTQDPASARKRLGSA
jgi:hypothetical protein